MGSSIARTKAPPPPDGAPSAGGPPYVQSPWSRFLSYGTCWRLIQSPARPLRSPADALKAACSPVSARVAATAATAALVASIRSPR